MGDLAPGDTVDQYRIDAVLARSGMATIFRARDEQTGRVVVLKVPHLQYESDIVFNERFRREEEIGLRLHHPAVIRVLKPKEKTRVYIPLEYVHGELLRDRLQREGSLPIDDAVHIAIRIGDALRYLHDHDVVHRDLKPENIMLTLDGGIKIMDFGIALDTTQRRMTWSGLSQGVGTPDYMAPEQIKGQRGDARTDLYGLGVILYEMLTGKVPFHADNIYAAMRAKVEELPVPPRQFRPEIPPALEEVVLHALEPDPAKRFESAFEMREALAHPGSVVTRTRAARKAMPAQRPRWARTLLIVVGSLLGWVAFMSILSWLAG
jgi:eukaryotic-like serine/threonine-protein kinase